MNCFSCFKPLEHGQYTCIQGSPPIRIHNHCLPAVINQLCAELRFLRPQNMYELGVQMKVWLQNEAAKLNLKPQSIYMRLARKPEKYYPNVEVTRLNQRVAFVRERQPEARA